MQQQRKKERKQYTELRGYSHPIICYSHSMIYFNYLDRPKYLQLYLLQMMVLNVGSIFTSRKYR